MHVELSEVTKRYGGTTALNGVSLNLPPASVVAVLGENGAGKSTLLRLLAAMLVPDKGLIRYDGREFDREKLDLRQKVFFTPDIPLAFPGNDVARNLAMFAGVYGRPMAGREEHLRHWLDQTGLAPLLRRDPWVLSRGQLWKMALMCGAVVEPELWLVDEPFASGMDAIGIGAWRRLARHLADRGSTILYTTQMVEMAAEFADRICVLREGRVIFWDSSERLRQMLADDADGAEKLLRGLREADVVSE
ncbi:MAG: ABC transporter ATP-binding protein [Verrucomicrobiaceae bacterium]|nr:ABC transporter ATP-binding protein [Verrucomicrobiaceae bacterium]